MLEKIIYGSLHQRLLVLLVSVGIIIFGILELKKSKIDIFPDLTAPTVTVLTDATGMTSVEIEQLITVPIENALNGISGLRRLRSDSQSGISVIYVEFEWGTDIYRARQLVTEKLQLVQDRLPLNVHPPILAPIASIMGEIMFIALHSETHSGIELKTVADWEVRQRLLAVSGVAAIIPIGGETKQYHILLKPKELITYGVSVDDVMRAVAASNQNTSAGFYTQNAQEYMIRGIGRVQDINDIANTFITQNGVTPVTLRDVADIRIGAAVKRGIGSYNGNDAVILAIQKQPNVNTLELTNTLEQTIDAIEKTLPEGMQIETNLFKQASFINTAIGNLSNALRDGAILVVLIVLLFLLSIRATLITLIAIPLSLFATVFLLSALNITINTMTLGGMAIALGVLVDDAIIVVENIIRRLQLNSEKAPQQQENRLNVIAKATFEIQHSIIFATFIILLVFVPLFFLQGMEGRLLAPLGLAYISALLASLFVAIVITPALCYYFLKPASKNVHQSSRFLTILQSGYGKILHVTLPIWKTLVASFSVLFLISLYYFFSAGKTFLPEFNEGSLTVFVAALPGTSLEKSNHIGQQVEQALLEFNEVVSVARRTGRGELESHTIGVHASELEVEIALKTHSKEDFLEALRERFSNISGANISIGQPISHRIDHMLSGSKAAIAIKVFGNDLFEQKRIAQQIKSIVENVEGSTDVMIANQWDLPQLVIAFNRRAMASYGISVAELSTIIQTAFYGTPVTKMIENDRFFDVVMKYNRHDALDLESIRSTLVHTSSGAQIPLHALVNIHEARMPYLVSREGMKRKTTITSNVAKRDLVSVVEEIQSKVAQNITLPKGYYIEYGGQFQSAQSSSKILLTLSIVVIFGVFLLLYLAFSSARDALLILVNLPFALIGGVIGLYIGGGVVSIATLIGLITLFGIATRNGVMMISHIHHLIRYEGVSDFKQAVKQGAGERLIPILMTALATGLAMIPLALGMGEAGSEIQAPMAMVILFGLLSSTLLNMIILPALYFRFGSLKPKV